MRARLSRRAVLRGAGVALALPWLESVAVSASAQASPSPKRFVAIYIPNGVPDYWRPPAVGAGQAWQLSSLLEPLAKLKSKLTVISGLENGSAFNPDGSGSVEPSHGRQAGAWLTCVDAVKVREKLGVPDANGVSVDQVMAVQPGFAGKTALPSLQIGLSSMFSYCEPSPCSLSRSVSWKTETTPLYKLVDPLAVFNLLTGSGAATPPASSRRDARKSVLDAVQESTALVRARVSASDKLRLDEFLGSVRRVEQRVVDQVGSCVMPAKPNFPTVSPDGFSQNTGGYDKSVHFDLMNDLLVWALQCDQTRIVSYMLEDERSNFVYDFVQKRHFEALTSTPVPGTGTDWHTGGQNGSADDYGTIVYWHIAKLAALCEKLASIGEADGRSVLDNSVIFVGSAMHGGDHQCVRLPALVLGSGGGALKTDRHVDLVKRPLRDFYFTLMNGVYDLGVTDFGVNLTGAPIALIDELLA